MTREQLREELHSWTQRSMVPAFLFEGAAKQYLVLFQQEDHLLTPIALYTEMSSVYNGEKVIIPDYRLRIYERMFHIMKYGEDA